MRNIADLRARWDERTLENAMYYINADQSQWSEVDFLRSGEEDVARFVDPVLPLLNKPPAEAVALDIGCGLGRLSRPLAQRFLSVEGIDISPLMIEKAGSFAPPVPSNIRFQVCDGSGAIPLIANTVHFIFSYIVFQHIPKLSIIKRYLIEMERVMTPGGLALIQINTQVRPLRDRFKIKIVASRKVPLLKRKLKIALQPHSTMGVVISIEKCPGLIAKCGLILQEIAGGGTQYTWLLLSKPQ